MFVANPIPTPDITDFPSTTKTYGDAPFSLSAHSTSEGAITYSIDDAGIATVSGTTVTIHGAGSTFMRLHQAPWGIYSATTTVSAALIVHPIAPSITFDDATRAYDTYSFSLASFVTSTSDGPFEFMSSNPSVLSIDGYFASILSSGTTTITAVETAYGNYAAATATSVFTVPGVCADNACGIYSSSCSIDTHGAMCHCVAGVTGARCTIGIDACALSPCGVHGVCTRTSTLPGESPPLNSHTCSCDPGFYGASCSLVSMAPPPDITFDPIVKYLGDAPFHIAVTSTSAGLLSFGSSNLSVATVSADMCTVVGVGTSTIVVYQSIDGDAYSSSTASTLMTVYENYCTGHANPCENGGTCTPNMESYACSCAPGFYGATCTDTVSTMNCDGSSGGLTCQNEGSCNATSGGGECSCAPCFFGPYCEFFDVVSCA